MEEKIVDAGVRVCDDSALSISRLSLTQMLQNAAKLQMNKSGGKVLEGQLRQSQNSDSA